MKTMKKAKNKREMFIGEKNVEFKYDFPIRKGRPSTERTARFFQ